MTEPAWPEYDERALFVHLVNKNGIRLVRPPRVIAPGGPDGGCWEHAWRYAQANGWDYVEGSVILKPSDGLPIFVRAHAWVQEQTSTGVVVHEVTEGYEDAVDYRGIVVNCDPQGQIAEFTRPWTEERGSVIEALIVNGLDVASILLAVA